LLPATFDEHGGDTDLGDRWWARLSDRSHRPVWSGPRAGGDVEVDLLGGDPLALDRWTSSSSNSAATISIPGPEGMSAVMVRRWSRPSSGK